MCGRVFPVGFWLDLKRFQRTRWASFSINLALIYINMKCVFYDLEACFLAKGGKREFQRILEIGMVKGNKTFQRLVNPVGDEDIIDTLEKKGQDACKTVHFWTKLLCEKKYLNTAVRRKPIHQKAAAIRLLLNTCDEFVSESKALHDAAEFGKECLWIAHNGKAFDNRIMSGYMDRLDIKKPKFEDSLPVLRRVLDLPSYSQPNIYKSLFQDSYFAHHALEDAKALRRILRKVSKNNVRALFDCEDLQSLRGIGPYSERVLKKHGIHSVSELRNWIDAHNLKDWNKQMRIYNYRKVGALLFKYGIEYLCSSS